MPESFLQAEKICWIPEESKILMTSSRSYSSSSPVILWHKVQKSFIGSVERHNFPRGGLEKGGVGNRSGGNVDSLKSSSLRLGK